MKVFYEVVTDDGSNYYDTLEDALTGYEFAIEWNKEFPFTESIVLKKVIEEKLKEH